MSTFAFERTERRTKTTTETVWMAEGNVTTVTTRTSYFTRYTVSGVEAVTLYADGGGRLYVPVSVRVNHDERDAGASVTVIGRLLRKDGSLGDNAQEIHRYSWARKARPAWLVDIVADAIEVGS